MWSESFDFTPLLQKMCVAKVRKSFYFHSKAGISIGKLKDKTVHLCGNLLSSKQILILGVGWLFRA